MKPLWPMVREVNEGGPVPLARSAEEAENLLQLVPDVLRAREESPPRQQLPEDAANPPEV